MVKEDANIGVFGSRAGMTCEQEIIWSVYNKIILRPRIVEFDLILPTLTKTCKNIYTPSFFLRYPFTVDSCF